MQYRIKLFMLNMQTMDYQVAADEGKHLKLNKLTTQTF